MMMNEYKVKELLTSLFALTYDCKSGDTSYNSNVIRKEDRLVVETIIREFLLDNRDVNKGILEAKVFIYEEIIKKSNFSTMITPSDIHKINDKLNDK